MKKLPKAVATQQARIPASVEVHSELQNFPEQESKTPMNKLQKENEVARTQFRPPNIRQSSPVADANMSSYAGFYNVRPQAVLPTQPFSRPPGYGHFKEPVQNTSAFQLYSGANYEELMQGVPMGMMMSELKTHSKLLLDLLDKVELHNKMLSVLIKDYQLNKIEKKQPEPLVEPDANLQNFYNLIGKGPEQTITKKDLSLFLKDPETEYRYQLELINKIDLPLVKERNFTLTLNLVDNYNKPVENSNKIVMSIYLYTADNPPVKIKRNTTGNDILKGHKDNILIEGKCIVPKLQIKEVTSHYRSGMVYLVIMPNKKNYNPLIVEDKNFVDFKLIKPLIIDQIRVKAKMPRKTGKYVE